MSLTLRLGERGHFAEVSACPSEAVSMVYAGVLSC